MSCTRTEGIGSFNVAASEMMRKCESLDMIKEAMQGFNVAASEMMRKSDSELMDHCIRDVASMWPHLK